MQLLVELSIFQIPMHDYNMLDAGWNALQKVWIV